MTNEVKNVPELRFPGFEDEWKINLFGELVTNKSDKYLPKNNEQLIDIELDSIESNTGRLIHKYNSSHFSSQKHKFNKNQVLYSKLRPYLNKYYFTNFNGVCSSEIWVLNTKSDLKLINEFIYNFIQTNKFSQIANKSAGSKMPRADWNLVENIRFNIPILKEQEKIGSFFSKLDRQIELEEQKLEKLEEQKKGYMQKIFSQELRFKDESGEGYPEWEEKKLGDVATIVGGGTPNTKIAEYWNGDINWFSPVEIGNDIFVNESKNRITELGLKKSSAKLLPTGTVLFTSRAGIGKTAILNSEACTNQGFQSIVPNQSMLDSYYIYSKTNQLKKYAEIVGSGSTFIEVSGVQMRKMPIMLPSITEQEKIGAFFKNIDEMIDKQNQKIDRLKERKQGFLQKMFV
ncbi:restriction endonuclease subunit S [Staphylococcus nepalensis]|uniref:restriction endonuclease subunit S n=1 Tax=Staphylococcus nepalensis TaxID=214473 RepID=UPI0035133FB7